MTFDLRFMVYGEPRPQGSKRGFVNKATGKVSMVESGGQPLRDWRHDVTKAALDNLAKGHEAFDGPVVVTVTFYLRRPKSHYLTGLSTAHLLRGNAPRYPQSRPDLDKLVRGAGDALKNAGVFTDDARVVELVARKRFCGPDGMTTPGARIVVSEAV